MNASYEQRPEGYKKCEEIDLKADKKLCVLVNLGALLIGLILGVGMHFIVPITTIFTFEGGPIRFILRFVSLLIGSLLYIVLHELTHAIAMKIFGTKKVKFGLSATYAYAGSDDYYAKWPYLMICLSPVVLFTVILSVLLLIVPPDFFWVIWWIQIANLSGATGDFYVTARFLRLPKNALIRDYGVGMIVYECTPTGEQAHLEEEMEGDKEDSDALENTDTAEEADSTEESFVPIKEAESIQEELNPTDKEE